MAVESPPAFTQAGSFSAEQTRRAAFAWAARTAANSPGIIAGGLISSSDCQVTAPASGLSVNVGTGEMLIGGNEGGSQGGYGPCRITSQTNLTIAANGSGNPRIDLVCGTVNDAQYTAPSGGVASGQWAPVVITGTPTAGATLSNLSGAPALPGSSLLLAYVLVPNGAANIITADIANKAVVATPGFFSATGLADGQPLVYTGSTGQWRALSSGNATVLQLPSSANRHVSFGLINGGAATISMGSGDFTVSRSGAGIYTVSNATWPSAYAVTVTATSSGGSGTVADIGSPGAGSFGVSTFLSTTGANVDTFFSFILIY